MQSHVAVRVAAGAEMVIRDATPGDLRSVNDLLAASDLPLEGVAEHLTDFIVAEERGTLAGAIGLERYGMAGLLRSAVVAPEIRGSGVGSRLVKRLLDRARASGITELYLLTTTADEYFPRFDFERTTRAHVPDTVKASAEFRGACPDSAVVMRCVLSTGGRG